MAEQAAAYGRARFGMPVCTVRLSLVFGPGRWYAGTAAVLGRLFAAAAQGAEGAPVRGTVPAEAFDIVFAPDAGEVFGRLAVLAGPPLPPLLNLDGLTTRCAEIVAAPRVAAPGAPPAELGYTLGPPELPLADGGLLRRTLGWAPAWSLQAAVAEQVAHLSRAAA